MRNNWWLTNIFIVKVDWWDAREEKVTVVVNWQYFDEWDTNEEKAMIVLN
jgi:hypothetical protein